MRYIFLVTIFTVLQSCGKNFLREEPISTLTPEEVFTTQQMARLALDGVYEGLQDRGFARGPYSFNLLEMLATDINKAFNNNTNDGLGDLSFTASNPEIYRYWTQSYDIINRANLFLNNVDKVPMDTVLKNKYKAEALFLRSLMFFNLLRLFGPIPIPLQSPTSLNAEFMQLPRSPLTEVYVQIIGDLEFAEMHLPDKGVAVAGEAFGLGNACRAAAQTVLAQLYLYRASIKKRDGADGLMDYQNAEIYANKVLAAANYSLEPYFPDVWRNKEASNKEVIFAVRYKSGAGVPPAAEGSLIGMYLGVKGEITKGGAYSWPTPALFCTTYFEAGDTVRRKWTTVHGPGLKETNGLWWIEETNTGLNAAWGYGKWRQFPLRETYTGTGDYGNHVPVLRLADIYLILAEAQNEINNGPTSSAINVVNLLRRRACNNNIGGVHADVIPRIVTTNATQVGDILQANYNYQTFKKYIFYERAREMAQEWTRYFDLQRWGGLVSTIKNVGSYVNPVIKQVEPGYSAATNIKEKHNLMPIPSPELLANPKLTQNPGY